MIRKIPPPAIGEVDVVIVTALLDELNALVDVEDSHADTWGTFRDAADYELCYRRFDCDCGGTFGVLATWTDMGPLKASGWLNKLAVEWKPTCIAMCGICAGWRDKTFQGDLIVAERLYEYDHGKLVRRENDDPKLLSDIKTYNLRPNWSRWIEARTESWFAGSALTTKRPISYETQEWWLLSALLDNEENRNPLTPDARRDRQEFCNDFAVIRRRLVAQGLVMRKKLVLTTKARGRLRRLREDGELSNLLNDPAFAIHVKPLATGNQVVKDRTIFKGLSESGVRTVHGLEMEAVSIGFAAELHDIQHWLVAKAVQDYADDDKDDRFRAFGCRVSAEFVISCLKGLPSPFCKATETTAEPPMDPAVEKYLQHLTANLRQEPRVGSLTTLPYMLLESTEPRRFSRERLEALVRDCGEVVIIAAPQEGELLGKRHRVRAGDHSAEQLEQMLALNDTTRLTLGEVVFNERQMVILGGPGSGKSKFIIELGVYIAKILLKEAAEALQWVPIFVDVDRLSKLASQEPEVDGPQVLKVLLENHLRKFDLLDAFPILDSLIQSGGVVVLVDGLDEVTPVETRKLVVSTIKSWLIRYPACRFVITSRSLPYLEETSLDLGLPVYQIAELSNEQVADFVDLWLQLVLPDMGESERDLRYHALLDRVEWFQSSGYLSYTQVNLEVVQHGETTDLPAGVQGTSCSPEHGEGQNHRGRSR